MKISKANNKIDLLEVFLTMINNKMKVVLIVALSLAVAFGFKISRGNDHEVKHSKFTTKFQAVSLLEENSHYNKNKLNINSKNKQLNRFTLFDVFTEVLNEEMPQLVKDFNFIKLEDHRDEKEYEDTLNAIISEIEIDIDEESGKNPTSGFIMFNTRYDIVADQWAEFIKTIEYTINEKTQKYLADVINSKIENAKSERKNKIEDVQNQIRTSLKYYDLEMKARLSFLMEQAEIAREGNVESEKVTSSSFGSNYSINYNEDGLLSLYYLKGYRVIEKEIELIKARKNSYLFAKNITALEARKLEIESDQKLGREEAEFKKTPIFNDEKIFIAGTVGRTMSIVERSRRVTSTSTTIIFASVVGLIIAIFYIFISRNIHNAMKRNRK
tara:strand:- start:80 stop:1234 length:1155 start_codon:yes stop_codon:yes gene_type:complete